MLLRQEGGQGLHSGGSRILLLARQQEWLFSMGVASVLLHRTALLSQLWAQHSLILGLGSLPFALCWLLWAGAHTCHFSKSEAAGTECITRAEN